MRPFQLVLIVNAMLGVILVFYGRAGMIPRHPAWLGVVFVLVSLIGVNLVTFLGLRLAVHLRKMRDKGSSL